MAVDRPPQHEVQPAANLDAGADIEHTKHLFRAFFVLVLIVLVGLLVRGLCIPVSFGEAGHYRLNSVADYMAKPVVHGDVASCAECHAKQWKARAGGRHASVSCEVCHPPPETPHTTDGVKTADVPINRANSGCLICHQKLAGRPKIFPQVSKDEHLQRWMKHMPAERIANARCLECHEDPHGLD